MTGPAAAGGLRAGWLAAVAIALVYGGLALSIDFARTAGTLWSDEATYLLMGQSLAKDGDLEYRKEDLDRALAEFPGLGPNGIFLKRGTDVTGIAFAAGSPFVSFGPPDPDPNRLYYGKSFAYPLFAAPFVRLFGTRGFLVLNALLLAVAFMAGYAFLRARSGTAVSLTLSSAFVFATVVPVYYVWIMPELFNFTLGVVAYFCWLYKYVAPGGTAARPRWLRGPASDFAAAALIGIATFSKVTNALLLGPLGLWLAWKRQWGRALAVGLVWGVMTAGFFGANVASSGEWNYQGGDRRTCYTHYPFERDGAGLEICDERGRDEAMLDVLFDPQVFWVNLRANLVYFVAGRNSGLAAYFFPAVFGTLALVVLRRRREAWQWFVLGGVVAQMLLFIVTQPYTYFGGGGSVGNRYFMGAYGLAVFLLPPIRSLAAAVAPWLVGGVFMAPLVLHPFQTSRQPAAHSKVAPLRWLPVELTNVHDLPLNNEPDRAHVWFGDNPGAGDLGFLVYYLDNDAYGPETDKSFWTRGESRTEILVRTDRPVRWLMLHLRSGPRANEATIEIAGRRTRVGLDAGRSADVAIALPPGFPFKKDRIDPSYVWVVAISSRDGFTPAETGGVATDTRFLGVRVKPMVVE